MHHEPEHVKAVASTIQRIGAVRLAEQANCVSPAKILDTQTPAVNICAASNSLHHANMRPYESESSDEGEDYTETNVLLGYATKDATGDAISHIGGAPVRLRSQRNEYPTDTLPELDRRKDSTIWRARQVQSLQWAPQPPARTQRRPSRPLSRPRAKTIHLELPAQGV